MRFPDEIVAAIRAHARWAYPEEACGLLATDAAGRWRMAYCLTNSDRAVDRYTVDPAEHFHAIRHAERHGWSITGVFHSHPRSAALPSPADVAGALDPDWVYVIAGPVVETEIEIRAYRRVDDDLVEAAEAVS